MCIRWIDQAGGTVTFTCANCGPLDDWAGPFQTLDEARDMYQDVMSYDVANGLCWQCSDEGCDHIETMRLFGAFSGKASRAAAQKFVEAFSPVNKKGPPPFGNDPRTEKRNP